MKKNILLLLVLAVTICKANFLTGKASVTNANRAHKQIKADSIQQLKSYLLAHKAEFIHRDLNTLLTALPFEVKSYSNIKNHGPGQPLRGITLFFFSTKD